MGNQLVEDFRAHLEARIAELEPLAAELEELRSYRASLPANGKAVVKMDSRRRRRPASSGSEVKATRPAGVRVGRPPGSGATAGRVIALVAEKPGMSIAEIAQELGMRANYLYRLIPDMVSAGKLRREDKRYFPAQAQESRAA
jgi:hypothetical protein